MTDKKNRNQQFLFITAAFALGFFSGIVFMAYKTSPGASQTAAPPAAAHDEMENMVHELEKALAENPDNVNAWIQMGHVYFDHGLPEKAIPAYEKAIELDPNNADVLTDLGVMYRRSKQPEKAVESFDKAIAVNPRHETSRFNKGIVLMHDMQDKEKAIQAWEKLMEINPLFTAPNGQSLDEIIQ